MDRNRKNEGANIAVTGRNVQKLKDAKEVAGSEIRREGSSDSGGHQQGSRRSSDSEGRGGTGRLRVRRHPGAINNAQASASGVPLKDHTMENFDLAIDSGF